MLKKYFYLSAAQKKIVDLLKHNRNSFIIPTRFWDLQGFYLQGSTRPLLYFKKKTFEVLNAHGFLKEFEEGRYRLSESELLSPLTLLKLISQMDVPEQHREPNTTNLRWLSRNLGIKNSGHKDYLSAIGIINYLLKQK